jgi:hypothetical protein
VGKRLAAIAATKALVRMHVHEHVNNLRGASLCLGASKRTQTLAKSLVGTSAYDKGISLTLPRQPFQTRRPTCRQATIRSCVQSPLPSLPLLPMLLLLLSLARPTQLHRRARAW